MLPPSQMVFLRPHTSFQESQFFGRLPALSELLGFYYQCTAAFDLCKFLTCFDYDWNWLNIFNVYDCSWWQTLLDWLTILKIMWFQAMSLLIAWCQTLRNIQLVDFNQCLIANRMMLEITWLPIDWWRISMIYCRLLDV